jgi:hypothetical protein
VAKRQESQDSCARLHSSLQTLANDKLTLKRELETLTFKKRFQAYFARVHQKKNDRDALFGSAAATSSLSQSAPPAGCTPGAVLPPAMSSLIGTVSTDGPVTRLPKTLLAKFNVTQKDLFQVRSTLREFAPLKRKFGSRDAETLVLVLQRNLAKMSYTNKIIRTANAPQTPPDEIEQTVAQALLDLENNVPELKSELQLLQISAAKEVDVKGGKKAIVVFVPVPMLKAFHKVQQR